MAPAAQRVGTVLGDLDRDRRQLRDLMAMRGAGGVMLTWIEVLPAARAALGPVVDDLIQL